MAEAFFSLPGKQRSGVLRLYRVGDVFANSDGQPKSPSPERSKKNDAEKKQEPVGRIEVTKATVTLESGLQPFLHPLIIQINTPLRIPAKELRSYPQNKKQSCDSPVTNGPLWLL